MFLIVLWLARLFQKNLINVVELFYLHGMNKIFYEGGRGMRFLYKPIWFTNVYSACSNACGSQCNARCSNLGSCFCPLK